MSGNRKGMFEALVLAGALGACGIYSAGVPSAYCVGLRGEKLSSSSLRHHPHVRAWETSAGGTRTAPSVAFYKTRLIRSVPRRQRDVQISLVRVLDLGRVTPALLSVSRRAQPAPTASLRGLPARCPARLTGVNAAICSDARRYAAMRNSGASSKGATSACPAPTALHSLPAVADAVVQSGGRWSRVSQVEPSHATGHRRTRWCLALTLPTAAAGPDLH